MQEKPRKKQEKSRQRKTFERSPWYILLWRITKPFLAIVLSLVIVYFAVSAGIKYAYQHYFSPVDPENTEMVEITIARGSSLSSISKQLEEEGLIRNSMLFKLYVDFMDMSSKLQSGKHSFSPSMSYDDIIEELKRGNNKRTTMMLTIAEGSNVEEIAEIFAKNGFFDGETEGFLKLAKSGEGFESYQFVKDAIEINAAAEEKRRYVLEGYLFCDTYEFYTDSSEETIINRLLARFNEIYHADFVARTEELGLSIDEVVTLASVIEKEARTADFAKVSSVFHNRLAIDMRLQSDATVQYYLGTNKLSLSQEELDTPTGYNTHLNSGLPLGPICQPSRSALEAALYADEAYIEDEYLYFCLAEPKSGSLVFAKTYEEHLENVEKYEALWKEFDNEQQTNEP